MHMDILKIIISAISNLLTVINPKPLILLTAEDFATFTRVLLWILVGRFVFLALGSTELSRAARTTIGILAGLVAASFTPEDIATRYSVIFAFLARVVDGYLCGRGVSIVLGRKRNRTYGFSPVAVFNIGSYLISFIAMLLAAIGFVESLQRQGDYFSDKWIRIVIITFCILGFFFVPTRKEDFITLVYLLLFPSCFIFAMVEYHSRENR